MNVDFIIEGTDIVIEKNDRDKAKKDYAKRVKALRERMGMTQQQFGDYFEIPKRTLQDWEGGKRKIPEYLLKLMEFKVDADEKNKSEDEK